MQLKVTSKDVFNCAYNAQAAVLYDLSDDEVTPQRRQGKQRGLRVATSST